MSHTWVQRMNCMSELFLLLLLLKIKIAAGHGGEWKKKKEKKVWNVCSWPPDLDLHRRTNNMKKFTDQFFREIPKTDLHVHLDGSIRIETLVELARQNLELPGTRPALSSRRITRRTLLTHRLLDTYTPHTYRYNVELKKTVFKDNYKNLEEYLEGFKYLRCDARLKSCERGCEFAIDNYEEGVRYFEVRFAPQLHASIDPEDKFGIREVLKSVDRGLNVRDAFNKKLMRISLDPRSLDTSTESCAMKNFSGTCLVFMMDSTHYIQTSLQMRSLHNHDLGSSGAKIRDLDKVNVWGVDIAGAERETSSGSWLWFSTSLLLSQDGSCWWGFRTSRSGRQWNISTPKGSDMDFICSTVDQVVTKDVDAAHWVNLLWWVSDLRITMEVCLTSNLNTMPKLKLEDHPFAKMIRNKVPCDKHGQQIGQQHKHCVPESCIIRFLQQLRELVITGFKRSFFPDYPHVENTFIKMISTIFEWQQGPAWWHGAGAQQSKVVVVVNLFFIDLNIFWIFCDWNRDRFVFWKLGWVGRGTFHKKKFKKDFFHLKFSINHFQSFQCPYRYSTHIHYSPLSKPTSLNTCQILT